MTVYVRAKEVAHPYLTAGKLYEIRREDEIGIGFYIIDDLGLELCCLWVRCGLLPDGINWERIEKPDYASDHTPRDLEPAVSAAWSAIYKLSLAHTSEIDPHHSVLVEMRDRLSEIIERANK